MSNTSALQGCSLVFHHSKLWSRSCLQKESSCLLSSRGIGRAAIGMRRRRSRFHEMKTSFALGSLTLYSTMITNVPFPSEDAFEPQLNPVIAVVCLIAAIPPVLFWARFFIRRKRRLEEKEAKEKARLELILKLTGRDTEQQQEQMRE